MTCSRVRRHGRVSVLALVIVVAAVAILALLVSSTILFDRSILQPIAGAYTDAPAAPAGSRAPSGDTLARPPP
jgi:hypothetical protein